MKYLYYILAIVAAATLLSLFFLWPDKEVEEKDSLFTINGQKYTRESITSRYSKFGYHSDNKAEMIDTAISRELLIQEAQRQAIDKEPNFRASLKNYYANGLIRILLDRKNDTIEIDITDADVDRYMSFLNTLVTFTRLGQIPQSEKEAAGATGVSTTSLFDDLAMPVKLLLASLSPGSFKVRFDTGNEQYAIRLDKIEPAMKEKDPAPDREEIRLLLSEYERERIINEWYSDLRNQASITIHNKSN